MISASDKTVKDSAAFSGHHEAAFDDPNALRAILSPAPDEELLNSSETRYSGDLTALCNHSLLSKEQELHLFRKMNCLKYLASLASNDDEQQDYLIQAMWPRNLLLKHNLRLAVTVVKPYVRYGCTVMELLSEATWWLMREIIDAYDYRMTDNTFAGFAADRIRKRIWSFLARMKNDLKISAELPPDLHDYRRGEEVATAVADELEQLRNFVYAHVDDEQLIDVIFSRLGLRDGNIQTTKQIGDRHGISYQCVQKKFDTIMFKLFGHTVDGNFIRSLQGRQKEYHNRQRSFR